MFNDGKNLHCLPLNEQKMFEAPLEHVKTFHGPPFHGRAMILMHIFEVAYKKVPPTL